MLIILSSPVFVVGNRITRKMHIVFVYILVQQVPTDISLWHYDPKKCCFIAVLMIRRYLGNKINTSVFQRQFYKKKKIERDCRATVKDSFMYDCQKFLVNVKICFYCIFLIQFCLSFRFVKICTSSNQSLRLGFKLRVCNTTNDHIICLPNEIKYFINSKYVHNDLYIIVKMSKMRKFDINN